MLSLRYQRNINYGRGQYLLELLNITETDIMNGVEPVEKLKFPYTDGGNVICWFSIF